MKEDRTNFQTFMQERHTGRNCHNVKTNEKKINGQAIRRLAPIHSSIRTPSQQGMPSVQRPGNRQSALQLQPVARATL
ncbi:hypothetical protein BaRGS_00028562 [Batillaria attramentaria]|uniref:Uncharacterized protein n=1 Tax=Batillaria attramentaria TaxID=370345 RepID=A0ABD0JZ28_9CAEN